MCGCVDVCVGAWLRGRANERVGLAIAGAVEAGSDGDGLAFVAETTLARHPAAKKRSSNEFKIKKQQQNTTRGRGLSRVAFAVIFL